MGKNLPEIAKEHEQEENSITAFRAVMRSSNFIIRDIRESDYGVDLNIEAKLIDDNKKYASNFLCQIQIKDRLDSSSIENDDGTYSYPLRVKTLNYLLNYPASIFMIYLEDKDCFVWEWANEIQNSAIKKGIDLNSSSQQTLTYRFGKNLNSKTINDIHKRIIQIGDNIRQLNKLILNNNLENIIEKEKLLYSIEEKNKEIEKYVEAEEYDKALKLCSNLAKVVEREDIFTKCSLLSLLSQKFKKAITYCNKSLNINSHNFIVHLIRSSAYAELKNYKQAIKSVQKSLAVKETVEGYIQYGLLEFVEGNYSKAIDNLNKALLFDKENEKALLMLGKVYTALLNTSKSIYYLERVLSMSPKNVEALALIGDNYRNLDNYQLASEYYHKCLDIESTYEHGLIGLGLVLIADNQIDKGLISISRWISFYRRKEISDGKGMLLINISLEKTFHLHIVSNGDNEIMVSFEDGLKIPVKLPNQNDKYIIGIEQDMDRRSVIPIVGKSYGNKMDFKNTITRVNEKLNPIHNIMPLSEITDIHNKTKLYIKEEKERVYIELNFDGYKISGHTNGKYKKSGFYKFVKGYKELNTFEVRFYNEEEAKEVKFTVNGNVLMELLDK
ncbi:DUF4365 domain-containing protein [Priestia megaterium]|uniref:DUF4365 domain-containing protein n=1 Tax=Priestia megaterium TaxID=1404 RepID=UPI002E227CFB|nr:DUF4365 domain-containing protein [Priestia megaterium]